MVGIDVAEIPPAKFVYHFALGKEVIFRIKAFGYDGLQRRIDILRREKGEGLTVFQPSRIQAYLGR